MSLKAVRSIYVPCTVCRVGWNTSRALIQYTLLHNFTVSVIPTVTCCIRRTHLFLSKYRIWSVKNFLYFTICFCFYRGISYVGVKLHPPTSPVDSIWYMGYKSNGHIPLAFPWPFEGSWSPPDTFTVFSCCNKSSCCSSISQLTSYSKSVKFESWMLLN